jgi:hypothetical protein
MSDVCHSQYVHFQYPWPVCRLEIGKRIAKFSRTYCGSVNQVRDRSQPGFGLPYCLLYGGKIANVDRYTERRATELPRQHTRHIVDLGRQIPQGDFTAFTRQSVGTRPPDATGPSCNHRNPSSKFQIHPEFLCAERNRFIVNGRAPKP